MRPLLDEAKEQLAYREALVVSIGNRRDPGVVVAFEGFLPGYSLVSEGGELHAVVEALLFQGTAAGVEALMGFLVQVEQVLEARAKERKKIARQKPRRKPREVDSAKQWKQAEESRIRRSLKTHDEGTAGAMQTAAAIREQLVTFSQRHLLPEPPASFSVARDWKRWHKAALEALPG